MHAKKLSALLLLLVFFATPVATAIGDAVQEALPDTGDTGLLSGDDGVEIAPGTELTQPYRHKSLERLSAAPTNPEDPDLEGLFLAFMQDQDLMATLPTAEEEAEENPNRPERPPPPQQEYKPQRLACDIDGDGVRDTIGNEQRISSSDTRLRAASGETGETVWRRDVMQGPASLVLPPYDPSFPTGANGVDTREHGQPEPQPADNAHVGADLDDDGVCDVVAIDFVQGGSTAYGCYVEMDYTLHVHGISGATGEDLWQTEIPGTYKFLLECVATGDFVLEYTDFPTGFMTYQSPSGPKTVIKTSDIRMTYVCDPACDPFYTEDTILYYSAHVTERLHMLDATDGSGLWTTELVEPDNARMTNIAWLAGAADLAGDDEPEILLHHLTITTPRGKEHGNLLTGEELMHYARGMRMTAVKGELESDERVLWTTAVHNPLAVSPQLDLEENLEILVWTHGRFTSDLNGDGRPTPVASYMVVEKSNSGTLSGRYRTYFQPLDGETGEKLWGDRGIRKQGWGFMEAINEDERAQPRAAIGMVDYPTAPPPGGQFPPKFVRLEVVQGDNGATLWSYERIFAQNSFAIYNTALAQFKHHLAPHDWTGDGWRDLVTPSQYVAPESNNQVLLAAASHTYDVLGAADGRILSTLTAWGPDGQILHCGGEDGHLVVVSGHPRRIDATRFDPTTGEQVWRKAVWNNPVPRAAISGTDVMAVGGDCSDDADGRTHLSVNMQAASFMRGVEVIAINGFLAADDDHPATWLDPWLRGDPAMTSIFEPHVPEMQRSLTERAEEVALGGGIGALAAAGMLLARRRGASATAAALAATVLLIGSGALAPLASALPTDTGPMALDDLAETADTTDEETGGAPATAEPAPTPAPPDPPTADAAAPPSLPAPAPRQSADDEGAGVRLPETPYLRFLTDLQRLEAQQAWTPQDHMTLAQQYFHDAGFDVPPPQTPDRFEEGTSISFTHDVGDADGDGIDDLLMDEYCVDRDACHPTQGDIVEMYLDRTVGMNLLCGPPHHLWAVAGQDGDVIWNMSLDNPASENSCSLTFVVDVLPLADGGSGVLLYTYTIHRPVISQALVLQHQFQLLDGATGEQIWSMEEVGAYQQIVPGGPATASNLFIHPIVQMAPTGGVQPIDADATPPALFLQGVGFQTADLTTHPVQAPGTTGPLLLVTAYKPIEWAAAVDIDTGSTVWREDTFQPQVGRNELPVAYDDPPFTPGFSRLYLPEVVQHRYWEHKACCFDNTGDGTSDLLYRVYEWTDTPLHNPEGPVYPLAHGSLVLYDGATGSIVFEEDVVTDATQPFHLLTQAVGDTDGDGAHDILLHITYTEFDYQHVLSMRSGPDGSETWRTQSPRELRVFVMGDATDDDGNDLLIVDWYGNDLAVNPRLGMYDKDRDEPQGLPLNLVSGSDGQQVWQVLTFAAPIDAEFMFTSLERNGIPDYDGDGVGDLFIDEPMFLGDQTIIHQQVLLSGRTLEPIYTVESPGAFAVPLRLPDVTGDGIDDMALMNGDLSDLWLTVHEGTQGEALWSTRLLSVAVTNYVTALPQLQIHAIGNANQTHHDFLVNYHMDITNFGFFGFTQTVTPQILSFEGPNGTIDWAFPRVDGEDASLSLVAGPSPATASWLDVSTAPAFSMRAEANAYMAGGGPALAAFAIAFLAVFGTGTLASRTRRIKEEVPDLEDL